MKNWFGCSSVLLCVFCLLLCGCSSSKGSNKAADGDNQSGDGQTSTTPPVDPELVQKSMTKQQLAVGKVETNSIGMVLIPIPAGEFKMGWSVKDQPLVKLTDPYFISATEVTQSQWKSVIGTTPWRRKSFADSGDHFPVTDATFEDAKEFCRKLSEMEKVEYRLPTEAEWEYACRAGSTTAFSYGDDQAALDRFGWYRGNAYNKVAKNIWTRRVGRMKPNPWGLYDMHGNVEEMVLDFWANSLPSGVLTNPTGPENGMDRIRKGGSIRSDPENCRSAYREPYPPDQKADDVGFRVVRVIKKN